MMARMVEKTLSIAVTSFFKKILKKPEINPASKKENSL